MKISENTNYINFVSANGSYPGKNFYDADYKRTAPEKPTDGNIFKSPKSIYDYLDSFVYSHDDYKRELSVYIWKHVHGHRSGAFLVAGQSGSGKTEMIRALNNIYPNIVIADGSTIVPQGYKGNSQLTTQIANLDFENEEYPPIVVIDEFDKLVSRSRGSWSDTCISGELLKFIEGGTYPISLGHNDKTRFVDTSNMAVILLGAFSSVEERKHSRGIGFGSDERQSGDATYRLEKKDIFDQLTPELIGRISNVVILNPLTEWDYLRILNDERYSPVSRLSNEFHLNLTISRKRYEEIAHEAYLSGTGVRSMNTVISRYVDDELFNNPDVTEIEIK